MKKLLVILIICQSLFLFTGCVSNSNPNSPQPQTNNTSIDTTPEEAMEGLLKALQQQNFSKAKQFYVENFDNMANFRNQLEDISPTVANQFFSKLADFTYTIETTSIDSNNPSQATAYISMTYHDIGKAFEITLLEYTKNNISMTYDGKKDDDISKIADTIVTEALDKSSKTTLSHIPVSLTLEDTNWKVGKMSESPELLNALSGNLLNTIDKLSTTINNTK